MSADHLPFKLSLPPLTKVQVSLSDNGATCMCETKPHLLSVTVTHAFLGYGGCVQHSLCFSQIITHSHRTTVQEEREGVLQHIGNCSFSITQAGIFTPFCILTCTV